MKTLGALLVAAGLALSSAPANAVVLDLSTMTCKQFIEGDEDTIKMVLTWMDGWYKGDSDEAIIDTDVFVENAKKFGTLLRQKPEHQHRQRRRKDPRQVIRSGDASARARGRCSPGAAMPASRTRWRPSPPACCRWRWTA